MHAAIGVGVLFVLIFFGTYILQAVIGLILVARWLIITIWSLLLWCACFCINPRRALESLRNALKES